MGNVACCDNDAGPPDLRLVQRAPLKRVPDNTMENTMQSTMSTLQGYMEEEQVAEKPVLGYWNIRGLAQQIRLLLIHLDIDFDDVTYEQGDAPQYSTQEWTDVKDTLGLDFPTMPYFIDEDVKLTETLAIMKYICVKHKPAMLGKTIEEQGRVDMLADVLSYVKKNATQPCYSTTDKQALGDNLLISVKAIVKDMEDQNTKFLVGNTVTYVDLIWFELCEFIQFLTDGRLFSEYPILQRYSQTVMMLPRIMTYMANDEDFKKRTFNMKVAKINNVVEAALADKEEVHEEAAGTQE